MVDPFGRELLDEMLQARGAADGHLPVSTLLVNGAPGAGRTTLLTGLAAELRSRNVWVGWGTANEVSSRRPFGVLSDALGLAIPRQPAPDTFDHVMAAVDALCNDQFAVVVIDDADLADAESLSALWRLSAAGRDLPLGLILARRRLPIRERLEMLAAEPWVRTIDLEPLGDVEVSAVVAKRLGAQPGPELRRAIAAAAGNPLQISYILDSVERQGRLVWTDDGEQPSVELTPGEPIALGAVVTEHLRLLDAGTADLVALVSVWGAPIEGAELATLSGLPTATVMRGIGQAIQSGVLRWSSGGRIEFVDDVYARAVYDSLDAGMRRFLHRACIDQLRAADPADPAVLHHLARLDFAADSNEAELAATAAAIRDVTTTLPGAPGVVADALASAAVLAVDDGALSAVIVGERAIALARSGQMQSAAAVAESALGQSGLPPQARAALFQTLVLTYSSAALVPDVDRLIDTAERSQFPAAFSERMDSARRFMHVLLGEPAARAAALDAEVSRSVTPETGTLPLVMKSIASMQMGDGIAAVQLAERVADGYRMLANHAEFELASVDIWPTQFRLYTYGRDDAGRHLDEWRERTAATGQAWVQPLHQANSALLALYRGALEDAAAEYDAALEAAAETRQGWNSWSTGMRTTIDIARGDLDAARARLVSLARSGMPDAFGLPIGDLLRAELAVASGDTDGGAMLAHQTWAHGVRAGHVLWMLLTGADHLRIAGDLADPTLTRDVLHHLQRIDATNVPALAPVVTFARAVSTSDARLAVEAAELSDRLANRLGAARMLGDAAVLAADSGDLGLARTIGHRATTALGTFNAAGDERAVAARLRRRGVNLGAVGRRKRPTTGWDALTPTETRVVALVAEGSTGPQIGRALYISPRTVQTHVSHALGKLGLTTRLELASAYARHRTG